MAMSIAPSAQAARKIASRRGSVLSELRGLALRVLGNATVTERLLLLLCVALLRRRDDRGIDNLAAHRQETRSPQKLVLICGDCRLLRSRFQASLGCFGSQPLAAQTLTLVEVSKYTQFPIS